MESRVTTPDAPEFKAAWLANEQQERLSTGRVACLLVMALMPVGSLLDWCVYPSDLGRFLQLRLLCSFLAGGLWFLHNLPAGQRHYRGLGLLIPLLPGFFIAWMIAVAREPASSERGPLAGAASPYYAGLNLIMLAVTVVVHWGFRESLLSVGAIVLMYVAACTYHARNLAFLRDQLFWNNLYFLGLTGIVVVTGNHLFNQLRLREFRLRYQLDANQRTLAEANRKLVELDQTKSRFFANISHELRTPLTLLLAPLETLIHRKGRLAEAELQDLLATMHANGMRLLKLINDLLDLVRLDSGKMDVKREAVHVEEFARGLITAVRPTAKEKGLQLTTTVGDDVGTILADRDKLEKVVLNLLFNALKFTAAGGRVELRAERTQDSLVLRVSDTGMGIAKENLPHVFDRFWQGDTSAQRKFQGAGIGLALVKELVEVQEGRVSVESEVGQGTTFTVRLPYLKVEMPPEAELAQAATSDQPVKATPDTEWLTDLHRRAGLFSSIIPLRASMRPEEVTLRGHSQRPRVLIADDEPDMLRFLKSQLSEKFQVLEAVNGNQAVEKAAQFLPDVILCDMMMPEKDGLQVCREVRQRTSTKGIPLLLITARADEETKLQALAAGASDFLAKPFSTTELNVRLHNLVEAYQYQRKLARQNQILESTIEQLKETETQLVSAEKMASLGRLSAGIMHEVNNPLNFMKTGLHVLRAKSQSLPEAERADYAELLADLEDGIGRVQGIVAALRTFAHPSAEKFDKINLENVISVALKLLSNDLKDGVKLEQHLAPNHVVWGNQNKLIQVFMNLIQNAAYAVKKRTFENGDQATVWIESKVDNGMDKVIVRDNGVGINPEHLGKIFEPFFTTKDVGEGMGLGLSICYRIIAEHEGRIAVKSEPSRFCEFTVELPRTGGERMLAA